MQNLFLTQHPSEAAANAGKPVALRLENVQKSFGGQQALRGINLTIEEGEQVALLGPNGAGKTTLVRSICGRCKIDAGVVELFGKPIDQEHALSLLGVVPQDLAIYGDLTAKENLEIFGRLHGIQGRSLKRRVDWALAWIGLEDRRNHLTKTFSGGMKRRVNIACGVLHAPKLLLLDEPTVGVDPQSRQRIFDMCDELVAEGTTIVLTTHHLDEAETRCDRIVIVDHGKVVANGSIEELIATTIGDSTRLEFVIHGLYEETIPELTYDRQTNVYHTMIRAASEEIPRLLASIQACGGEIADMQMHRSDLNQVFLHLTGRDLRE